jgi:hypothetical protein
MQNAEGAPARSNVVEMRRRPFMAAMRSPGPAGPGIKLAVVCRAIRSNGTCTHESEWSKARELSRLRDPYALMRGRISLVQPEGSR